MQTRRVWIATEVRSTQVVLDRLFRRAGFEVVSLPGPHPLVARLGAETPDLLIADGTILEAAPGLAESLERAPRRTAIIVLGPGHEEAAPPGRERRRVRLELPLRPADVLRTAAWLLERGEAAASAAPPPSPAAVPEVALCGLGPLGEMVARALQAAGYGVRLLSETTGAWSPALLQSCAVLLVDLQSAAAEPTLQCLDRADRLPGVVTLGRLDWRSAPHLRRLERLVLLERPAQLSQILEAVRQVAGARPPRETPWAEAAGAGS